MKCCECAPQKEVTLEGSTQNTLPSVRSYSRILDRAEKAGQEKNTLAYFPVPSMTKEKKLSNID